MSDPLIEHVHQGGLTLRADRTAGVIHGVKILGLKSNNGRVYRRAALEQAIPLYEAARVNVNHPKGSPVSPRGYEERIGTVRNIVCREQGLYGDFHFNPKHQLAEQLLWDAEHMPENVGFSHNVLARTSQTEGQTVVEEIVRVQSVDLVADPATTRGLFEQDGDSLPTDPAELAALVAALRADKQQLVEQLGVVRSELGVLEQRAAADRALAASGLPAELLTAGFREQCHAAPDAAALEQLIEARRDDARLLAARRPRSIEQSSAAEPARLDAASFAAAIR